MGDDGDALLGALVEPLEEEHGALAAELVRLPLVLWAWVEWEDRDDDGGEQPRPEPDKTDRRSPPPAERQRLQAKIDPKLHTRRQNTQKSRKRSRQVDRP